MVIAKDDVASGANGQFYSGDAGLVPALLGSGVTSRGMRLCAGTANSTGHNVMIANDTTINNTCAWAQAESYQGATTLSLVVLDGAAPRFNSLST